MLHLQKFEKSDLCALDLSDMFIVSVVILNFEKVCQVLAVACQHLVRVVGVDIQGKRVVVGQGVRLVASWPVKRGSQWR